MVVNLSRLIYIFFIFTIFLNASDINFQKTLEKFKKNYKDSLEMALNKTEYCAKKANKNSINKLMLKNINLQKKVLQNALFYLSVRNNLICEEKTLDKLVIDTSNYLFALKRYDEKNIDLQNKIEGELKSYQFSVYSSKRLMYESKENYEKISDSDKKKLNKIKELKSVFNFDDLM
ncbi:hypothetical protein ACMC56_08150 [Campylobacterota bacterium DY0563]